MSSTGQSNNRPDYVEASTYSIEQSFGGHHEFMAAYGLKPGEEDEGSAIIQGFKDYDRYVYESSAEEELQHDGANEPQPSEYDAVVGEREEGDYEEYQDSGTHASMNPAFEEDSGAGQLDEQRDEVYEDDAEPVYDDPQDDEIFEDADLGDEYDD